MAADELTWEDVQPALYVQLTGRAGAWYRASEGDFNNLREFRRAFLYLFGRTGGNRGRWTDVQKCTQDPGEKMRHFLWRIRSIFRSMHPVPSTRKQLDQVYRNMLPEYRRFRERAELHSYDNFEQLGRRVEELAEIDLDYRTPK